MSKPRISILLAHSVEKKTPSQDFHEKTSVSRKNYKERRNKNDYRAGICSVVERAIVSKFGEGGLMSAFFG
jgi:hypothetical protein